MFPFATNKFKGYTNITFEEFAFRLESNIFNPISYKLDGNFYGKLDVGVATFELSIRPMKDSCRPVVVMKWDIEADRIVVQTKCRLHIGIHVIVFLWMAIGIYIAIQDKDITSILPMLLLSLLAYFLNYIFYKMQMNKTLKKLNILFSILEIKAF